MSNRILINPRAFAAEGRRLQGRVSLNDLDARARTPDVADPAAVLEYALQGGTERRHGLYLQLHLAARLPLFCQRCLQRMDFDADETARIFLFDDEAALETAMNADEDIEGMVCGAELDVYALLEDQILMALPFAPKHDACETAVSGSPAPRNPFAALAGLKKSDDV